MAWASNFTLADLAPKRLAWEHTYNTVRPREPSGWALGYLTPQEFLDNWQKEQRNGTLTTQTRCPAPLP